MIPKYYSGAIKSIHEEIPNVNDFYTDEQVVAVLKTVNPVLFTPLPELFMEAIWDRPIRRCSFCGKLMTEGYILHEEYYACSEECCKKYYEIYEDAESSEEAYKMYIRDCYDLSDEDIEGLTTSEIEEKFSDYPFSDNVFWTSWEE